MGRVDLGGPAVALERLCRAPLRPVDLPGRDVGPGAERVGLGGPAVALERLCRAAEVPEDVAPSHVHVCVPGIDFDGPVVRRKGIRAAARPRKDASHGRVGIRVAWIRRDRLAVPLRRLVVPAEALGRLAGDHAQHRRVGPCAVHLCEDHLVRALRLVHVAARHCPVHPHHQEHGAKGRHLPDDAVYVLVHSLHHQAPIVPHGPPPVRMVVAHAVERVRRSEQLWIPLEHARHAQIVLDGPYVVDALDLAVEPEQGCLAEAGNDPCKLWKIRRSNVQVDGGMHVLLGIELVLPDLAVGQLYACPRGDRHVLLGDLAHAVVQILDFIVALEYVCPRAAEQVARDPAEPPHSGQRPAPQ